MSSRFLVQMTLTLTLWCEMISGYKITQTGPPMDFNLEPPPPSDLEPTNDAVITYKYGPPVRLPEGSLLLPDGTIRFPNSTTLATQYAYGAVPPAVRTPSGAIIFLNGTEIPTRKSLPPPGIILNATTNQKYPSLNLPNSTVVFRDGAISIPGYPRIHTVFKNGFIPNCNGIECHHRYF